jgi:hypothetical protein
MSGTTCTILEHTAFLEQVDSPTSNSQTRGPVAIACPCLPCLYMPRKQKHSTSVQL